MMRKILFIFFLAALAPACALAGTYKSGGVYEVISDTMDGAGLSPVGGGGYTLYQAAGQGAGYDTGAGGDYVVTGGFLGTIDETPPTISFTNPPAASNQSGIVNVIGTAQDVNGTVWTLSYGPGASPSSWRDIATGTVGVTSATLLSWDASQLSGSYTLRVVATDGRGNTATGTVTFALGNTATVTGTIPKFKWMLMSVPVQPATPAPVAMYGNSTDYKLFRWDPTAAEDQYLSQYRYPASLSAGQGFWIKAYYNDLPYSYSGSVTDTARNTTVPLKAGWNSIGTPFNRTFPWSQVIVKQGAATFDLNTAANMGLISTTLFSYDGTAGSWAQNDASTIMAAQQGYDVRAYADVDLVFGPGAGMPGGLARVVHKAFDYKIKLSARAEVSGDTDNYFGTMNLAANEYDASDAEEPPRSLDDKYTTLYFPETGWKKNAGKYANDFRAPAQNPGDAEDWNFNVDTNETGKAVTLSWDKAALPVSAYGFTLTNLDTGERVNMADAQSYSYVATGTDVSTAHFKIESVKQASGLVAKTLSLKPGWNLISVPVEPTVTSATALLGNKLPAMNVYQYFDGQFYDSGKADIQAGLGYWMWVKDATQIDIPGSPVPDGQTVSVPLKPGWNLVGDPYDAPILWGDNIVLDCGGVQSPLSKAVADAKIGSKIFSFDGENYTGSGVGSFIVPWSGYLLKSSVACDLVLAK